MHLHLRTIPAFRKSVLVRCTCVKIVNLCLCDL